VIEFVLRDKNLKKVTKRFGKMEKKILSLHPATERFLVVMKFKTDLKFSQKKV